jgi:hypothetical protein
MQNACERAQEISDAIHEAQHDLRRATEEGEEYPDLCNISNAWKLAKRIQRAENRKPGQVLPIYIAVQGTSRCYGGPEEGGWWYNWTETEEVFKVWTMRAALRKLRELREEYLPPRFSIYSAANRGEEEYSFVITHDPSYFVERESTERPTYC